MTTAPSLTPAAALWRDSASGYGRLSRFLHGATLALLVVSFTLAWTWGIPGRGPIQTTMIDLHRQAGVMVLVVTLIRVGLRLASWPATVRELPRLVRILARVTQAAMLGLLVLIPLAGWIYTNAGGFDVKLLGLVLPRMMPRDSYVEDLAVDVHETLATALIVLVGLHVAGAGWHRFGRFLAPPQKR